MIAIDSSALVCLLLQEPAALAISQSLERASMRFLSAANWLETAIVIEAKRGSVGALELDALVDLAAIEIVPVTAEIARAARIAYRYYGKGRHPAALNFGDCFAYGLAKTKSLPLLATGGDFAKTDLDLALT
ncbi:MAG: type II toxin-antitoxin system VapC family toxin [Parvularculaceae bacterium]